jgi:hypothetical protein
MHHQQRWGETAGHDSRQSVFSQLDNGQSGSSGPSQGRVITSRTLISQEKGKAPMQRVYVPKKIEVPVAPSRKPNPLPSITIGSMEAPITNHLGPIVIEDPALVANQSGSTSNVAEIEKEKHAERDPKYLQPKWCPPGLTKTKKNVNCSVPSTTSKRRRSWRRSAKKFLIQYIQFSHNQAKEEEKKPVVAAAKPARPVHHFGSLPNRPRWI